MDAQSTLTKIMTYLGMETPEAIEVAFEEKKIKEGDTKFEAESFESGKAVFIVNEDDEKMPAPEGMYQMEDDHEMKVDEMGIIASYEKKEDEKDEDLEEDKKDESKEAEEDKEEMEAAPETAQAKKVVETESKVTETHFSEIESIKTEMANERNAWETAKTEYETKLSEMTAELEELKNRLAEEPAAEPLAHSVERTSEPVSLYKHSDKGRKNATNRVFSNMYKNK